MTGRSRRRHADELVLEAGDELAGADIDADSLPVPPSNRAVDPAGEIDDHAVAVLDFGALVFRRIRLVLLGDLVERVVDLGVGNFGTSRSSLMVLKSPSAIGGSTSTDSV